MFIARGTYPKMPAPTGARCGSLLLVSLLRSEENHVCILFYKHFAPLGRRELEADSWLSVAGGSFCGGSQRLKVVQLAGVDQVQSLLTHALEARVNLPFEGFHPVPVTFAGSEIEVEVFAQQAIGNAGKSRERILDAFAKETLAELGVVDGNAE